MLTLCIMRNKILCLFFLSLCMAAGAIEFKEGQRSFTTWLLEDDGNRVYTETFTDGKFEQFHQDKFILSAAFRGNLHVRAGSP